jgi:DNA-binding MarR family transcriptional regulator
VQVLEALLHYPDDWFNLHDLATISGAGKASVKRVIDAVEASGLDIVEEKPTEGTERERLVKLKDTQLARELRFFYMKLRGML